jgi:hypothetical protein
MYLMFNETRRHVYTITHTYHSLFRPTKIRNLRGDGGDVQRGRQVLAASGFPRSHGSKHIFPSPQRIKVRPGSCNLATVAASFMEKTRS